MGWTSTRSWSEKARRPTRLRSSIASTSSRGISRKVTSPDRAAHIRSRSIPSLGGSTSFAVVPARDAFEADMSDSREIFCIRAFASVGSLAWAFRVEHEQRARRLPGYLVGDSSEHQPAHSTTPTRGDGDEISSRAYRVVQNGSCYVFAQDDVRAHRESFLGQITCGAGEIRTVSYTHLRAHETVLDLVCRLLL